MKKNIKNYSSKWNIVLFTILLFYSINSTAQVNITQAEYFIDNDLGFGANTPITITAGVDISNIAVPVDISSIGGGFHNLYIRTKDANGLWSVTNRHAFFKNTTSTLSNIVQAEYFIDNDLGFGANTPIAITAGIDISNIAVPVDISSIGGGFHNLYIRTKDANGLWSVTNRHAFFKNTTSTLSNIVQAEYFIDNDLGFGANTPIAITAGVDISNIAVPVDISSIGGGFHNLYIRTKDANGLWSVTNRHAFFKNTTSTLSNIVQAEYFIDNDLGFGANTPIAITAGIDISNIAVPVDISSIGGGFHNLYIRTKDANGLWSVTNRQAFFKSNNGTLTNIVKVEYFLDIDPGFGAGIDIPITASLDINNLSTTLDLSSYSLGSHMLYLRAKDASGNWSITNNKSIYIYPQPPGSGEALSFDGLNDQVELGNIINSQEFSIDMWVKPSSTQNAFADIIDNNHSSQNWVIQQDGSTTNRYCFGAGGVCLFFNLLPNVWQHVALVKTSTSSSVYINGVLVQTISSGLISYSSPSLRLGNWSGGGRNWNGTLDELRFWDNAITQSEIRDRMCHKLISTEPGYNHLISYYRFDENIGSELYDISGINNGTLINSPTWVRSGAPIGNISNHNYSGGSSSVNIAHPTRGDDITATLTSGLAAGIHAYCVLDTPNTLAGTTGADTNRAYFGVFTVNGSTPTYDIVYNYDGIPGIVDESSLQIFKRDDNADSIWDVSISTLNTTTNTFSASNQFSEFIIGKLCTSSVPMNIVACDSFTLNTTTYTVSGVYSQVFTNIGGCDSTVTITLTINQSSSAVLNLVVCDSIIIAEKNYNTSGVYLDTLVNSVGCDSFLTLNLTVLLTSSETIIQSICAGSSVLFNTIERTTSGVYLDTLVNSVGCDSFLTLNLTVLPTSSETIVQSICAGSSVLFNTIERTTSGIYLDTLVNSVGCDSFLTLNLTVLPISDETIVQSICAGSSVLFNTIERTTSGVYLDTLVNSVGCDSFLTLNLTVLPTSNETIVQSICAGSSVLFNTIERTTSGVYLDTLVNSVGCDSFLTLNLTVLPISDETIVQSICAGSSVLFNTIERTTSGVYLDTLVNSVGCDSFLTLNLTVLPTSSETIIQSICAGSSVLFNTIARTTSGVYLDTLMNSVGCDSFITLNLNVLPTSIGSINDTICTGASYLFNGVLRTVAGIYKDTILSSAGCDSILTLNLFIKVCATTLPAGSDALCSPFNVTPSITLTTPYAASGYANINTHSDTIKQNNLSATYQTGEPIGSCGSAGITNKTTWTSFVAPKCATPQIIISTDDRSTSNFDTRVSAYRRVSPTSYTGGYTEIACSDNDIHPSNTGASSNSTIVLSPASGTPTTNQYVLGETVYIQTSGVGSASGDYGLIVDIEPYVPLTTAVTDVTATLDWSTAMNTAGWGGILKTYVQWRPVGSGPSVAGIWRLVDEPLSSTTVSGLLPNTSYEYWASYICGNGGRWWSKKDTFTTDTSYCVGSSPTIASVVPGTSCTSAIVSYTASNIAYTSYRIIKKRLSTGGIAVSSAILPAPGVRTYTLTSMAVGQAYDVWIVAYCGSNKVDSSAITHYTVCTSLRQANPDATEQTDTEKDVVYILPNGDMVYGMPVNAIDFGIDVNNPNEQEIELQTIDANEYFGREVVKEAVVTKVGEMSIYPNPATSEATISYTLEKEASSMVIRVMDAQGKEMMNETITNPEVSGIYNINLNNYSAGIYFVKIQAGDYTETKKLIVSDKY